jgi:hypothetical protein
LAWLGFSNRFARGSPPGVSNNMNFLLSSVVWNGWYKEKEDDSRVACFLSLNQAKNQSASH